MYRSESIKRTNLILMGILCMSLICTAQAATYTSQYPLQDIAHVNATTYYDSLYYPYFATDSTKSLTGVAASNSWLTPGGSTTNQAFYIRLQSSYVISRIYYENYHLTGSQTTNGMQNFTVWGGTSIGSFAGLTYANDTGWTQITASVPGLDQHVGADTANPKYFTLTNSNSYEYYRIKFDNNFGGNPAGVRRIELQSMDVPVASFTSQNVSIATNGTAQRWTGASPFIMQFTDTSTLSPSSWKWVRKNLTATTWTTFNTTQNARDTFVGGNWSVNLTATNGGGSNISTQNLWVNVTSVVSSFTSQNVSIAINSTSQGWAGYSPFTIQFTDTSTNSPTSWVWASKNLTSTTWVSFNTSKNARNAFWIGNWSVNLTASNGGSNISTQTLLVNVSSGVPVSNFISQNVSVVTNSTSQGWAGAPPLIMQFTDTSTLSPTSWEWSRKNLTVTTWTTFNTSKNARDVFVGGNWSVNLTTTNAYGTNISTRITTVNVSSGVSLPIAISSLSRSTMLTGWYTWYNSTFLNSPTTMAWVFGEGGTSSLVNGSKVYARSGIYNVSACGTNAAGTNCSYQIIRVI